MFMRKFRRNLYWYIFYLSESLSSASLDMHVLLLDWFLLLVCFETYKTKNHITQN